MEEIKKILTEQLKQLREESKGCTAYDLSKLTEAMCTLAKTIKEI